jgi:hypothetical protein
METGRHARTRWISGGVLSVAVALAVSGSPPAGAETPGARGTGQAAQRYLAHAGCALPTFSRPLVATGLSDLSCPITSLCMAAGVTGIVPGLVSQHLATEIWNGRSWQGLASGAGARILMRHAMDDGTGGGDEH